MTKTAGGASGRAIPDVRAVAVVLSRLGLPTTLLSPLGAHADAVRRASPRVGLVSTGDEELILPRHTADSLLFALARAPKPDEQWIDVGSGGGFPGLVLAICYPQTVFTLVEAQSKKAGFLDMQVLDLGLSNVTVSAERAERLEPDFDVAVARAVTNPEAAFPMLLRLVKDDGIAMVAGTGWVQGARVFQAEIPEVDSPKRVLMMTPTT